MSNPQRAQHVLYESDAALRLVDRELRNLHAVHREEVRAETADLTDLPRILERANALILGVLSHLRESRAVLRSSVGEQLQGAHQQLGEVTSATEDTATNITHACDRATQLVEMEQHLLEIATLLDIDIDRVLARRESDASESVHALVA